MMNKSVGCVLVLFFLVGTSLAVAVPVSAQDCAATVNVWLDAPTIEAGQCTLIHWTSTNATGGTLTGDFTTTIDPEGSWEVCPPSTQTYVVEMYYPGSGTAATHHIPPCTVSASVTLTVNQPQTEVCPVTVSAWMQDPVIEVGQHTYVNWSSTNATDGTLTGDDLMGISVPTTGSWEVWPSTSQVYTVEMFGYTNRQNRCSETATATLTVNQPEVPPPETCPPAEITSLLADLLTIDSGACTDINWTIENASWATVEIEGQPSTADYIALPSGSQTVCLTETTMYRYRAFSGDRQCGDDTHTIRITVRGDEPDEVEGGPGEEIEVGAEVCEDWLVFHTDRDQNWELYQLDMSGSGELVNLTHHQAVDIAPSRSPDGEWVAFQSMRDDNWEIYVVQADDPTVQQRLTFNAAADIRPVWGPGTHIVYQSDRDGNWNLYDLDVATGVSVQLTDAISNEVNPYWSPDGTRIVFQSDRPVVSGEGSTGFNLYILDVATGTITPLFTYPGQNVYPIWSPDGARIAFLSNRTPSGTPGDVFGLYVINADGSGLARVSPDYGGSVSDPVWSPDGQRIAFSAALETTQREIYVVEIDAGVLIRVTQNELEDYAPTWACGGSDYLVFTQETTPQQPDLFTAPAVQLGATPTAVVVSQYRDQHPLWTPRLTVGPYRVSRQPYQE